MTKYLVRIATTCSFSDWYEADSEEDATKQAENEFENMEDFGDIVDVDFKILEKRDE